MLPTSPTCSGPWSPYAATPSMPYEREQEAPQDADARERRRLARQRAEHDAEAGAASRAACDAQQPRRVDGSVTLWLTTGRYGELRRRATSKIVPAAARTCRRPLIAREVRTRSARDAARSRRSERRTAAPCSASQRVGLQAETTALARMPRRRRPGTGALDDPRTRRPTASTAAKLRWRRKALLDARERPSGALKCCSGTSALRSGPSSSTRVHSSRRGRLERRAAKPRTCRAHPRRRGAG